MNNKALSLLLGFCLSMGFPAFLSAQIPCSISGTVDSITCGDNGTPADSTDDVFSYQLTVIGDSTGTWMLQNDTLQYAYDTTYAFGPFAISGGTLTLIINAGDSLACSDTLTVVPPGACSVPPVCTTPLTDSLSAIMCSDNSTPLDSLDDTYTFKLTMSGGTGGWSFALDSVVHAYDSTFMFGPFKIDDGPLTLIVVDTADMACSDTVLVTPPAPCSVPICTTPIAAAFAMVTCNDNGTALDSLDDVYTFQMIVSGGVGSWTIPTDTLQHLYDSTYTVGPFPISGGPLTLIATDSANFLCMDTVLVTPPGPCSVPPPPACDTKEIGCMVYELLGITQDMSKKRTYQIRVTNNCTNKLCYTAFELPKGVVAKAPADGDVYTAPSGRDYMVRNPNFSPFYSIRYKTMTDSISDGQSDIFEYTLPPQSEPDYIHVTSRVSPIIYYEAYLNTFKCPVKPVSSVVIGNPGPGIQTPPTDQDTVLHFDPNGIGTGAFTVYPNPVVDHFYVDLSDWQDQSVQLIFINSMGKILDFFTVEASEAPYEYLLPAGLDAGLYWLKVIPPSGKPQIRQVVLQW